jgi:hypothetical protein
MIGHISISGTTKLEAVEPFITPPNYGREISSSYNSWVAINDTAHRTACRIKRTIKIFYKSKSFVLHLL